MSPVQPSQLSRLVRERLTPTERSLIVTALETEAKLRHQEEWPAFTKLASKLGLEIVL